MANAVVRTDNLTGIVDGSKLVTLKIKGTAVENGTIVALGDALTDIDRDAYDYSTEVEVNNVLNGTAILVATPEIKADKKYYSLDEFTNEVGTYARGYVLEFGDEFSCTKAKSEDFLKEIRTEGEFHVYRVYSPMN